jgi:hypothetical protein
VVSRVLTKKFTYYKKFYNNNLYRKFDLNFQNTFIDVKNTVKDLVFIPNFRRK